MTLILAHKKTNARLVISNDNYETLNKVSVSGDSFLVDYFEGYFNKQLTTNWGASARIPDKFIHDGKINKHTDEFLSEYFKPLYGDIYDITYSQL